VVTVEGVVASGTGKASAIMVDAFPHVPGSLNLHVGRRTRSRLLDRARYVFPSQHRVNRYLRGRMNGIEVWVGFSRDRGGVELFSDVHLRDRFGLQDGDIVTVEIDVDT
jgi:CTP-dependent riboflavin kinase